MNGRKPPHQISDRSRVTNRIGTALAPPALAPPASAPPALQQHLGLGGLGRGGLGRGGGFTAATASVSSPASRRRRGASLPLPVVASSWDRGWSVLRWSPSCWGSTAAHSDAEAPARPVLLAMDGRAAAGASCAVLLRCATLCCAAGRAARQAHTLAADGRRAHSGLGAGGR